MMHSSDLSVFGFFSYLRCIVLFISVDATVTLLDGVAEAEDGVSSDTISMRDAINAIRNRSDRIKTVSVEWTAHKLAPKVAYPPNSGINDPESLIKATEQHVETGQLIFDRERLRLTRNGMIWTNDAYLAKRSIYVNDGDTYKVLYDKSPDDKQDYPLGRVQVDAGNEMARFADIVPVMLLFRPLSKEFGNLLNLKTSHIAGHAVLDGRKCVKLLSRAPGGVLQTHWWLDIERDFVPVRLWRLKMQERVLVVYAECDVSYTSSDFGGWIPASWKYVEYSYGPQPSLESGGSNRFINFQTEATVKACRTNLKLTDEDFQLDFPVGTYVNDIRIGESYIVKERGEKRIITTNEKRPDVGYSQLIATESGQAVRLPQPSLGRPLFFWINVGVLVVVVAILIVRRNRQVSRN